MIRHCQKSYTADTDAWRSPSSQKPEVYNQHFPTLSDKEEKRLDQYIKASYTRSKDLMDRSVTVYAWLFDPIDAGPFGRHCLIPEKMRLYRLGSADKLLRKLLSARIGTQWWRSYRSICCLASRHQMLSIRPATRQ